MALTLTLEGGPASVTDRMRHIARGQLRLGRGSENDWVLHDPERYLSKRHCIIAERGGEWWITDESTNGIFVDDQVRPLGRGNSARLRDGSWVRLGDYRLHVRIEAATEAAPSSARIFDHSAQTERAVAAPKPAPTSGGVFETEWRRRKLPSEEPVQPARAPSSSRGGLAHENPFEELDRRAAAKRLQRPESRPERAAPSPAPGAPDEAALDPFDLRPEPSRRSTPPPPAADLARAAAERPVGPGVEPKPAAARSVPGMAAGEAALLDAFLAGAGIDPAEVQVDDPQALMGELGESFQAMARGLAQLLATRAMIKREIGVTTTVIGGIENNPLKHWADEHEAVLSLIQHRGAGYLEPKVAIEHALEDIQAHELAVLEGVQSALKTVLQRFDPAVLEKEIEQYSLLSRLAAGGRKAKYWQIFKQHYAEIAKSARTHFLGDIGPYFARAYERKVNRW